MSAEAPQPFEDPRAIYEAAEGAQLDIYLQRAKALIEAAREARAKGEVPSPFLDRDTELDYMDRFRNARAVSTEARAKLIGDKLIGEE
jgi:hypothetical protein